jgi:hypothetical protein|tara:strand:+ start:18463 stop:18675 length:213 start_codon:yes stop_codon:yes gene_type:complete
MGIVTNEFEQFDKDFAFMVFYIEKEFNIGMITDDVPILKLYNLMDTYNLNKYNEINNPKKGSGSLPNTLR